MTQVSVQAAVIWVSASSLEASAAPGAAIQSALDSACQALVEAANANGGHDNITVLLLACP